MFFKKGTILIGLIAILILCSETYSKNNTLYISPGVTFGWNFGNGFTITPKVSLGVDNESAGTYYNLTYGYNFGPGKKVENPDYENYHFIEVEGGSFQYYSGIGAGMAIFTSGGKTHIYPKLTAFTGFLIFINMDMVIKPNGLNTNLGLQPNIPLPLTESVSIKDHN